MTDEKAKDGSPARRRHSGRSWFHPHALARGFVARPKLYWSIAAGAATFFLFPGDFSTSVRAVLTWDVAATVYFAMSIYVFGAYSTEAIKDRANEEDETGFVFAALVMVAIAVSLASVVGLIGEASKTKEAAPWWQVAIGGLAVLLAWLVLQTIFTLHYAHEFYHPESTADSGRGLRFPGDEDPDYWDFFYFTTSIGAASQTSDVEITSRQVRRTVAIQAIISFIFNTAIVALSINLAASLFQR